MKTYSVKPSDIKRSWYIVDGDNKVLGRLAANVAHYLRGKHKPEYTAHMDTGDYIIIINADKIRVTGRKTLNKKYYRHSGYPGGIYVRTFEQFHSKFPCKVLEKAVKGMLPKGPLGYAMIKKLKVYAGNSHNHIAQQPTNLEI